MTRIAQPRRLDQKGYVYIHMPGHPRASTGYVYEHVLVAERAVGRFLPLPIVVHHHNETKGDNRNSNLAILPDDSYHHSLHRRRRVQLAGGDPWHDRLCCRCRRPRPESEFYCPGGRHSRLCKSCNREYQREHYGRRPHSEYHPHSKLGADDVRAIRAAVAAGEPYSSIAARFPISAGGICRIVQGKAYRSVA